MIGGQALSDEEHATEGMGRILIMGHFGAAIQLAELADNDDLASSLKAKMSEVLEE